jgi:hypothetical protein
MYMRLQATILVLMTAVFLSGCTTFSLSRSETIVEQKGTSHSAAFQRTAEDFQKQFSKAGWLRTEEAQGRTRAFLSLLSKGWSGEKDKNSNETKPKDAIALYLSRLEGIVGDDPSLLAGRLQQDIGDAYLAMQNINALAMPLLTSPKARTPEIMRANVMKLERVLLSARKAHSLFEGTSARLSHSLELITRADLSGQLVRNAAELARMKTLADDLNTLRLQDRPIG